jgi:glycosyltransferase involved in cell wall biosynthesis
MNICYILPGFSVTPPGGVRVVYKHVAYLKKLGHQVTVIHPEKPYHYSFQIEKKSAAIPSLSTVHHTRRSLMKSLLKIFIPKSFRFKINLLRLFFKYPGLPIDCFRLVPELSEDIIPLQCNFVVATWWETAFFVNDLKLPVKKYYFCQGYELWGGDEISVKKSYELPNLHLIAVSKWVHDKIMVNHNRESTLILNGQVHNSLYPKQKQWSTSLRVGYLYRPEMALKGFGCFVNVARMLLENNAGIIYIGGIAPPRDAGINYKFWNCGSSQKMRNFYHTIDILVFPSTSEGFGLPIIEAMACGTPVVSTPVGIALDIIKDGENSFMTEGFESNFIFNKLESFRRMNNQQRDAMCNAATKTTDQLAWDKQIDKILYLFTVGAAPQSKI